MPFDATPPEKPQTLPSARPANPDRVVKALLRARMLIENDWGRGSSWSPRYCVLQAIAAGAGQKCDMLYGGGQDGKRVLNPLWAWNDHQRDNRPILALIDATIAQHRHTRFFFPTPRKIGDRCRAEVFATFQSVEFRGVGK